MMRRSVERVARMDAGEIAWRAAAAARIAADRARFRLMPMRWSRAALLRALAPTAELQALRSALAERRWDDADGELSRHLSAAPRRFAIATRDRAGLALRVASEFPGSAEIAAARADRILAGEYDLLGYRGLRFGPGPSGSALPDWSLDPVAGRRAPRTFWADVPYLDPACGDHKVIWELNRHQHWLALGRAYWLTGRDLYRTRFLNELRSWLDHNPPLAGINWASMLELALRSISWMWAIAFFVDADDDGPPWLVDLLAALDRQLAHVERNLSYYFSPNTHLLGEALALYVCGRALPQLAASARREALGRTILLAQAERQIATDGGHAERSMHYHRYALDFYLLALVVARNTGDDARRPLADIVVRIAGAARLLADDRGRLPHIGDDDGGSLFPIAGRAPDDVRDGLALAAALTGCADVQIGPMPEEALWMLGGEPRSDDGRARGDHVAIPRSPRSGALPETGYYVSRSATEHIVIDGGPHGYQNAGHAHADALSLTMTVRDLPLIIDAGTACYTIDPALRDRMRSSALHNTVSIDGRSQSVPRGPFHWAHAANARVHAWRANDAFDYFDGTHDGYAPVEHRRRVVALHGDLVVVADLISGEGRHTAAAHWHLDPQWAVDARGRTATLVRAGERVDLASPSGTIECLTGDAATGLGWYSPAYGALERTTAVRIAHAGAAPFWMMTVFGLNAENAIADVEWVPVWAEAGAMAHGAAVRITRAASIDYVLFAEPADGSGGQQAAAERTFRVGEIETDARALVCRLGADRPIARLALVDGSLVRMSGRRGFLLAMPHRALDLHVDFAAEARVAGAALGARLVVGGQEQRLERDRRGEPRA
jgi:heparinase II/III-like protein